MMRVFKQRNVGKKTGQSLLSVNIDNTDNRLKHDREMEMAKSSSKTLKKLKQAQQKRDIIDKSVYS